MSLLAMSVAVAVAAVALLSLHHAQPRPSKPAGDASSARGRIIAEGGVVIASNRRETVLQLRGSELAPTGAGRDAELALLSRFGIPAQALSSAAAHAVLANDESGAGRCRHLDS